APLRIHVPTVGADRVDYKRGQRPDHHGRMGNMDKSAVGRVPDVTLRREYTCRLHTAKHLHGFSIGGRGEEAKGKVVQLSGGESIEFMSVQYGNAVRAAHPKPSVPIFLDVIDTVACQSICDPIVGKQPIAEPKEAIVPRSDPEPPILVLVQRPD